MEIIEVRETADTIKYIYSGFSRIPDISSSSSHFNSSIHILCYSTILAGISSYNITMMNFVVLENPIQYGIDYPEIDHLNEKYPKIAQS